MTKLPISVCIIAKNEEKYIEDCLKRAKRSGIEIIVTDTGSTDRTKKIAAAYADKVLDFVWVDDFSAARNYCAAAASNDWILALDCDEMLESFDENAFRVMVQKYPKAKGALQFKLLYQNVDGEEVFEWDKLTRFYNRRYYEFQGTVHEQIVPKSGVSFSAEENRNIILPVKLVHLGYKLSQEELHKKQQRNLVLLEKSVLSEPGNPYLWFQIGQSYFIAGQYAEAVSAYERALSIVQTKMNTSYVPELLISLSKSYAALKQYSQARDILLQYAGYCKLAKYSYALALAYIENEQPLKALLEFIKIIALPDAETLGTDLDTCYGCIIELYQQLGDGKMADFFREKRRERFGK